MTNQLIKQFAEFVGWCCLKPYAPLSIGLCYLLSKEFGSDRVHVSKETSHRLAEEKAMWLLNEPGKYKFVAVLDEDSLLTFIGLRGTIGWAYTYYHVGNTGMYEEDEWRIVASTLPTTDAAPQFAYAVHRVVECAIGKVPADWLSESQEEEVKDGRVS